MKIYSKTDYTSDSGFNLTATAERNGLRFITVIMDAETSSSRNADTTNLMNYGFNKYYNFTYRIL